MKTENEENLEKVRKEGVRMRGQGEGGRKEGKEIRKEEGWRMSIFHLFLSFSSFFCKNSLFFLSLLPSFILNFSLHFLFPSSLTSLSSPCVSYISVFLSFLTSSFPPVLSTLIISSPPPSSSTFPLFISYFSSVFTLSFLSLLPHILPCVSLHFLSFLPSFLPLLFLMLPLFLSSFPSSLCLPPLLLATLPLVLFFSSSPSFLSFLPVLSSCFLHISVFPSFLPPPPLPRHISQEGFVLSVRPPLLVFPFISQNLNMVGV